MDRNSETESLWSSLSSSSGEFRLPSEENNLSSKNLKQLNHSKVEDRVRFFESKILETNKKQAMNQRRTTFSERYFSKQLQTLNQNRIQTEIQIRNRAQIQRPIRSRIREAIVDEAYIPVGDDIEELFDRFKNKKIVARKDSLFVDPDFDHCISPVTSFHIFRLIF